MRMTTLSTVNSTNSAVSMSPSWVGRPSLAESRAYCEYLTRTQARNFYYGLKLLPEPKRSAMFALYAYMRLVDDIADEEDGRTILQRVSDLDAWGDQTRAVLDGRDLDGDDIHIVWPAFADMAQRHGIPAHISTTSSPGSARTSSPSRS